ncbi:MAG: hypothetical protein NC251_03065 [Lachnoclostridium sp.]|nr:hypothetical protein [Lachnospira sp.]MCM1247392.1 hypothetical protein [Lachnoclostridium sp.]
MEVVYGNRKKDSFPAEEGLQKYVFYSSWYEENDAFMEVLSIEAAKMEIFQVGADAEINAAIFDVGYEYIGGQLFPYYDL